MELVKLLDPDVDRHRVQSGGVWPVGASRMIDEKSCWVLNEIPAELCEQLFMQQRELPMGIENERGHWEESGCSDWRPQVSGEWTADVEWTGQCLGGCRRLGRQRHRGCRLEGTGGKRVRRRCVGSNGSAAGEDERYSGGEVGAGPL